VVCGREEGAEEGGREGEEGKKEGREGGNEWRRERREEGEEEGKEGGGRRRGEGGRKERRRHGTGGGPPHRPRNDSPPLKTCVSFLPPYVQAQVRQMDEGPVVLFLPHRRALPRPLHLALLPSFLRPRRLLHFRHLTRTFFHPSIALVVRCVVFFRQSRPAPAAFSLIPSLLLPLPPILFSVLPLPVLPPTAVLHRLLWKSH
jgi:hypothetical protein